MKLSQFITFLFLLITSIGFSQKTIKHSVASGESIYSIAKKYGVSESDIYELNPKSKGALLQLKTVLLIPNKKNKSKNNKEVEVLKSLPDFHIVESGESLYKISKKYNISIEKLKELNPDINPQALQIGDKIKITSSKEVSNVQTNQIKTKVEETIVLPAESELYIDELGNKVHKVNKGETLYRISKKYKVSVRDLEEMNPEIIANLPIGYEVIVVKGNIELENHQKEGIQANPRAVEDLSPENMSKAEFLIAKASEHIGTRYRGGGTTSAGFDCSGLMFSTFKHIDMTLPRSSSSMAVGAGFKIDRSQAQKGDLIFFTTNGRGSINHVGMITEINGDEIKFIHSSVQAGVIISSTEEPYYKKRFVQINRVLENQ
ncbi:LysM peptidoglycan-binding domain-containing protein [Flavobacterium sp.]|uniref:LysM peptidoglycan-binding domain-containing protein n=1 Tax=Flavobacterium sp. TaxID=239 RepID=UPI004047DC0C